MLKVVFTINEVTTMSEFLNLIKLFFNVWTVINTTPEQQCMNKTKMEYMCTKVQESLNIGFSKSSDHKRF